MFYNYDSVRTMKTIFPWYEYLCRLITEPRNTLPIILLQVREENFDGGGEGLDSRYREKLNFTVSCYVL
jgi:hypothetical protein